MKKKIMIVMAVILVAAVISVSTAFAKNGGEQGDKSPIDSMFDAMRSWVQQEQDKGEITKDEAKEWNEHFDDMEKDHEKNGFPGFCGGVNSENGNTENQNYNPGYGRGMMGGFSANGL